MHIRFDKQEQDKPPYEPVKQVVISLTEDEALELRYYLGNPQDCGTRGIGPVDVCQPLADIYRDMTDYFGMPTPPSKRYDSGR